MDEIWSVIDGFLEEKIHGSGEANGIMKKILTHRALLAEIMLALIIIGIGIYFRSSLLQYYGFYEPDGFYHFAVIRAAVEHDFIVPNTLSISGWPKPTSVAEAHGLYWITLLPYAFLQFAGISYYDVMRLMPLVFATLDIIGAYLLSRYLSKDKLFGLLVMAFVAFSMGNAARTSATIYRGDTFAPTFVIFAIVLLLEAFRNEKKYRAYLAVASGIVLSFANATWNGGPFGVAIFITAYSLLLAYAFIAFNEKMMGRIKYMLLTFASWFLLVEVYISTGLIGRQAVTDVFFLMLFVLMIVGFIIADYLRKNKIAILDKAYTRLALVIAFVLLTLIAIWIFVPYAYSEVFFNPGTSTISSSFAATIQELQPPSSSFLYASFGPANFMTPMSIILYISTLSSLPKLLFWALICIVIFVYMFMKVTHTQGFDTSSASFAFVASEDMLVLISYFIATAYLQINAVRFNSLISIPIAIFVAYTIYWLISAIRRRENIGAWVNAGLAGLIFYFIVSSYLNLSALYSLLTMFIFVGIAEAVIWLSASLSRKGISGVSNAASYMLIISSFIGAFWADFFGFFFLFGGSIWVHSLLFFAFVAAMAFAFYASLRMKKGINDIAIYMVILTFLFAFILLDVQYTTGIVQADNINPMFISAMQWMKNNTPSNSVVLTLWPDGSVVEGIANRTSITDSVGAQNLVVADPFATWLFNSSSDPGFLFRNISGEPDYLVVRYNWLLETAGIYTESQLPQNQSYNYGALSFTNISYISNATSRVLTFYNQNSALAARAVLTDRNGTLNITGYAMQLGVYNQISPFSEVVFYSENDGNVTIENQEGKFNKTNGNMLMVAYSSIPRPGIPVNITNVYMFSSGMAESNMMKFLFLCGYNVCPWDNSVASLKLVYINQDTKIFKIEYNDSLIPKNITG